MQTELFQAKQYLNPQWYFFKDSELGRVYDSIPWNQLSECLPEENQGPGAPRWFDNKGMLGLMFLKAYLNLSDEKLIERFNSDYCLQLFCGKLLKRDERIRDKGILSRVRSYIAENANWKDLQGVLINHWKRDMSNTHVLMMDATCYESYIRYPTDIKLLWESCQWLYEKQLFKWSKLLRIKRPRSKYIEQKQKQRSYQRRRKNSFKQGQKRIKSLLYLLEKGLNMWQQLRKSYPEIKISPAACCYLKTIKKVLFQQQYHQKHPGQPIEDRIVSLHKPYIRPIKRGKENKPNEFGLKVHMLQVDGICFIDQMSFNAFNESTRLKISVLKHKSLFKNCNQLAADQIYANNQNRRYLTEKRIFTNFPRKGPKVNNPHESELRSLLSRQRATVLEGSFGTHKVHYGLQKIKARNEKTEKLWVFFGVMTANAVLMSRRKQHSPPQYQQVA